MRKTNKKILLLLMLACFCINMPMTAKAAVIEENMDSSPCQLPMVSGQQSLDTIISPLSDIIDWRYKRENNQLYKRQYNYTKKQWTGEWELCR
ncbi:hypothetical protein [Anaerocolumna jejuensis]|uniref:hypothetical protein n=1 Tax=Anaerocolumna jejuensis TaxID=259063 RepID=UPI003F7BC8F4